MIANRFNALDSNEIREYMREHPRAFMGLRYRQKIGNQFSYSCIFTDSEGGLMHSSFIYHIYGKNLLTFLIWGCYCLRTRSK